MGKIVTFRTAFLTAKPKVTADRIAKDHLVTEYDVVLRGEIRK